MASRKKNGEVDGEVVAVLAQVRMMCHFRLATLVRLRPVPIDRDGRVPCAVQVDELDRENGEVCRVCIAEANESVRAQEKQRRKSEPSIYQPPEDYSVSLLMMLCYMITGVSCSFACLVASPVLLVWGLVWIPLKWLYCKTAGPMVHRLQWNAIRFAQSMKSGDFLFDFVEVAEKTAQGRRQSD